ncbi:MAG TPA: DUF4352 domain-containing protein [Ktedonobacterales bacterium]|nr:DUF4352 domain-containing protein [Ktedonobacterales bacterium]
MGQQPPYQQPQYPQQPQQPMGYPSQLPPMPQPPKKKNFFRTIPGIVTGIIIVCCVLGGLVVAISKGGGSTTPGGTGNNGGSSNSSSSTSRGPAKVGDTITTDDVSCTLVSVKVISGDEFIQPKAGNEFIVVHVKIVNKSSSEFNYNEYDFHVKSGSGNVTDAEFPPTTYTANNLLNNGTLTEGGNVEGDIILQAPKGDHNADLTWTPSIFSSNTDNVWRLGL